jgi:hypothetical protein
MPPFVVDTVFNEIEELKEEIDLVPQIITKQQLNDSSFEFRPFTEEEKNSSWIHWAREASRFWRSL